MPEYLHNNLSTAEIIAKITSYLHKICMGGIALAFSGGVDSTFLLHIISDYRKKNGCPLIAFIMQSDFLTGKEKKHAIELAEQYHVPYRIVEFNPMEIPQVEQNSRERCYHCKRAIFQDFQTIAAELNYHSVLDGTNADDLHVYRPGLRALRELGILSPLAELGITKAMIRSCLAELGLECAQQPSKPCLATRFEYDTILTHVMLERVAKGEAYLQTLLGDTANLRLRICHDVARIEVSPQLMPIVLEHREQITDFLKSIGYRFACLDLSGFHSGSFDR